ncbi:hypothetical protein Scep_024250 [Stephania cephalantha]|uniref:SF4 helicase domain-containing protein n=1 Tax=Stephania cephalantha TaxID=152367 RepID=A0AAP0EYZ0_9MAGN
MEVKTAITSSRATGPEVPDVGLGPMILGVNAQMTYQVIHLSFGRLLLMEELGIWPAWNGLLASKIKRFAQHHSCHVWFVAHPRQLQQWNGGPPNLYDISGSAHFINKCDNGIVIHRNRDLEIRPLDQVQVCVRKVRNKVVGTIGDAFLSYNRITGEFMDIDQTAKR